MEVKKSPRADLENKKSIFLEVGLMFALGVLLLAFEWKVSVQETSDFITVSEIPTDIEMIPVTQFKPFTPPPPPMIKTFDLIEIIEENEIPVDELEINDATDESANVEPSISNLDYEEEVTDEIIPFVVGENMPVFQENVQKWVARHVKYPQIAIENNIQGKVYVQFVIEKDGSVSNIKVLKGVDESIDKEAIRVISSMPNWKPGLQRGKPVRVAYTMPIAFQLGNY